jgi:hypothetical protein
MPGKPYMINGFTYYSNRKVYKRQGYYKITALFVPSRGYKMDEIGAIEETMGVYATFPEENTEYEMAYIKQVELEFTSEVDDILRSYNMSYLKINS